MARYTIVKGDSAAYVDGVSLTVDCSAMPNYFHAIQWYGDATPAYGEIEYAPDAQGRKMPNTRFSDFAPYQYLVDNWNVAKAAHDEQAAGVAA